MTETEYDAKVEALRQEHNLTPEEMSPFSILAYEDYHGHGYRDIWYGMLGMIEAYVAALKARGASTSRPRD